MKLSGMNRFCTTGLASLLLLTASVLLKPMSTVAQELPTGPNQAQPIDPNNPNVVRPTSQETGILSQTGGQRLMQEASSAVSAQNYSLATKKLQDARQVFNQLSNFYQDLVSSFSGIDNRIADSNRRKALETAQMRDEATYQLALVHRAQNQPELAVPLLIQIIRSQQPTRDLGKKAYQQLFELGFVDSQYPRPRADQPTGTRADQPTGTRADQLTQPASPGKKQPASPMNKK
ncbi:MAG: hypothetical protein HC866_02760 [Leptolyngbyaceae cyanobacterium RU_5_1]|nr:hypothetical protein [Leptolyngbyaceae cyanobacterium RU_5_1]